MRINKSDIIGEAVAEDYRLAKVFDKYSIDFCCNGDRSIESATKRKNIETDEVIHALNQTLKNSDAESNFKSMELDELCDYIENTHHSYVEKTIPLIKKYLKKISAVHGDKHPELHEAKKIFFESAGELTSHMKKEELILFPLIRKLVNARRDNTILNNEIAKSVKQPIKEMMEEHDQEGGNFRKIRSITEDYKLPQDACASYKFTFNLLKEFESDLHKHIHLENNILFPKSKELESEVQSV